MSKNQPSQLDEKILQTQALLSHLSTHTQAVMPWGFRTLHRITKTMPASVLPVVICWVLGVIVATQGQSTPILQLRFLISGMMTILSASCATYLVYRVWGKLSLADTVLGGMASFAHQLAYHPNMVLKKKVEKRGFATRHDYMVWAEEQHTILTTKLNDQKMQIELQQEVQAEVQPPRSAEVAAFLKM